MVPEWRRRAVFSGYYHHPELIVHETSRPGMDLSPRQLEAVRLAARHKAFGAAFIMGISYPAIRSLLREARIKLGARSKIEMVLAAIGRGYLTCEDVLG